MQVAIPTTHPTHHMDVVKHIHIACRYSYSCGRSLKSKKFTAKYANPPRKMTEKPREVRFAGRLMLRLTSSGVYIFFAAMCGLFASMPRRAWCTYHVPATITTTPTTAYTHGM